MDGLIALLVIIGISAISTSNKKKKQQKAMNEKRAFSQAAESVREGKSPQSGDELVRMLKKQLKGTENPNPAPKAPINREILAQFMPELAEEEPAEAKPVPAAAKRQPAQPLKRTRPAVKMHTAPAPLLYMDHDEPEGTVSTQGESAEEHARHRERILAEEEKNRLEHQALQDVRNMNLQKLRTAVVMSEILDKPVSLRRRSGRL